jgi:hypothetical protein
MKRDDKYAGKPGFPFNQAEASPLRTIVGGRPPEKDPVISGKALPDGIQKLLLAASVDGDFEKHLMTDRAGAAAFIEVELTGSEKAILAAVPEKQLALMIAGMKETGKNLPRRTFLTTTAATLAAFVATAFGAYGQEHGQVLSRGISPDSPAQSRGISFEVPPLTWISPLDRALVLARDKERLLMVVFLRNSRLASSPGPGSPEAVSEELCNFSDESLRRKIFKWDLVTAQVNEAGTMKAYKVNRVPTILVLSPAGKELGRIVQPLRREEILDSIREAVEKNLKESR